MVTQGWEAEIEKEEEADKKLLQDRVAKLSSLFPTAQKYQLEPCHNPSAQANTNWYQVQAT